MHRAAAGVAVALLAQAATSFGVRALFRLVGAHEPGLAATLLTWVPLWFTSTQVGRRVVSRLSDQAPVATLLGLAILSSAAMSVFGLPQFAFALVAVNAGQLLQDSSAERRNLATTSVVVVLTAIAGNALAFAGWAPSLLPHGPAALAAGLLVGTSCAGLKITHRLAADAQASALSLAENERTRREELHRIAVHDHLTGALNRRGLQAELQRAAAHATGECGLGLVFLDLDGFKAVNDTHGHDTGDAVLCAVVDRFRDVLREQDQLARLGGDEFVAVLPATPDLSVCEEVADRLLKALDPPILLDGLELAVGVSIGTAFTNRPEEPAMLLAHADGGMYRDKQARRARARANA